MKVSVSIQCYQQADTIRRAAESVLMQKADFPFEVIAGDDASTDETADILGQIEAESGGQLKPLIAESNPGDFGFANMAATFQAAKGEYIALLDGDDYWTSPDKLQKQVDFLDSHPACNICAHRVVHIRPDGLQTLSPRPPSQSGLHDVGKLIVKNFAPKISTMLRRSAVFEAPDWYWTAFPISADWVMNVLCARGGGIGFIDEAMAVRNIHGESVSAQHGPSKMLADKLRMLSMLSDCVPNHKAEFARSRRRVQLKLLVSKFPAVFDRLKRINEVVDGRRVNLIDATSGKGVR